MGSSQHAPGAAPGGSGHPSPPPSKREAPTKEGRGPFGQLLEQPPEWTPEIFLGAGTEREGDGRKFYAESLRARRVGLGDRERERGEGGDWTPPSLGRESTISMANERQLISK